MILGLSESDRGTPEPVVLVRVGRLSGSKQMLEALGNIGEFVAAIAVIVSLFYVGFLIRENTRQLKTNALIENRTYSATNIQVLSNADQAEVYLAGKESYPNLSPLDNLRFQMIATGVFNSLEIAYFQQRSVLMDEKLIGDWDNMRELLNQPGIRAWWDQFSRSYFSPEFKSFADELIETDV